MSALPWVSYLCFPSQLGCKPPEGAKVAFTPKGSMFSPIHLIIRLFAQSGSAAMLSSALPSKTRLHKKTAGRLCTHSVRDCFHSQQGTLGHCWETGLALPGPALPGAGYDYLWIWSGFVVIVLGRLQGAMCFSASITWVVQRCCF